MGARVDKALQAALKGCGEAECIEYARATADIVAWLRAEMEITPNNSEHLRGYRTGLMYAADAIERGDFRKGDA